jgi:hypothetical protein
MKLNEVRKIAARLGLKTDNMKKAENIVAIQIEEGSLPCFETWNAKECGQANCLWRTDCK